MFVFSYKTTKKQLLWMAVCALLLVAIVLILVFWPDTAPETPTGKTLSASAASADEGIAYLASLGYTATGGDVQEVQMPEEFDETLTTYNALQQTAGMDLTPYRGKRLKCRTFTIKNHPLGEPAVAHLYVYKDKVVAGDISSTAVGGFTQALLPVERTQNGTAG